MEWQEKEITTLFSEKATTLASEKTDGFTMISAN